MALLRKLKGSTLMETMVATVLIIVIFMVSSLVLNNIFLGYANRDTRLLDNRIRELEYRAISGTLKTPYDETYENWALEVTKKVQAKDSMVVITAKNLNTDKTYIKERILE